jgi:glycine dehydrogenase subunit 1
MYASNRGKQLEEMLREIGVLSVEDLFADIPETLRLKGELDLPGPLPEWELMRALREMSERNTPLGRAVSFLGGGCYDHHIPAAVKHLIGRSEFATAYTPYQPELSQGTLQAIFEFQTSMARLTAMEVANASMYDGASALAEAVLMAQRLRPGRRRVILSGTVHPEYGQVVRTLTRPMGLEIVSPPPSESLESDWERLLQGLNSEASCLVVQNPNFFGTMEDLSALQETARRAHEVEALFIVMVAEPISLGVLLPPGEYGADIVVAEGQSLGIPPSFGGPHLGIFATREELVRQMPGRLVGQTQDRRGNRGFVLTMATREQHIRRERATSNICTNQSLCALAATVYLALLGPRGLQTVAALNLQRTHEAMEAIQEVPGFRVLQGRIFNEFAVRPPVPPAQLNERLLPKGILGGLDLSRFDSAWDGLWLLCCTERTSREDVARLVQALWEAVP